MNKVTSAGGIVVDGVNILLLKFDNNKYSIPKGHVEYGESFEQAAIREVEEETGVKPEILHYLGEYTRQSEENSGEIVEKTIKVYKMRKIIISDNQPDENSEWVNVHEAIENMHFQQEVGFIERILSSE